MVHVLHHFQWFAVYIGPDPDKNVNGSELTPLSDIQVVLVDFKDYVLCILFSVIHVKN